MGKGINEFKAAMNENPYQTKETKEAEINCNEE